MRVEQNGESRFPAIEAKDPSSSRVTLRLSPNLTAFADLSGKVPAVAANSRLVTDACAAALRAFYSAAPSGR